MARTYFLGIDAGTSSVKALLLAASGEHAGEVAEMAQKPVSILRSGKGGAEGSAELDPAELFRAVASAVREVMANAGITPSEVRSVGISTLCPALVLYDRQGNLLNNPIMLFDTRSAAEAESLVKRIGADTLFSVGANRIVTGSNTLPLLLWFRKHRPEIFAQIASIGYLHTWLGNELTGERVLDYSSASYSGLFKTGGTKSWSSELIATLGLSRDMLPPLASGSDLLGKLRPEAAEIFGLDPGIPVSVGGADTACAALAMNVFSSGEQFLTLGTSGVICAATDSPVFDNRCMNRCHITGDSWLMNGAMSNSGLALSWVKELLYPDTAAAEKEIFKRMDAAAARTPAGSGGVVFLPYLVGERTPVWNPEASGVLHGLKISTSQSDIIRAALESTGYGIRQILDIVEPLVGEISKIPVTGGGSKSPLWLQCIADITKREIAAVQMADSAGIGAALIGAIAAGEFSHGREAAQFLKRAEERVYIPDTSVAGLYDTQYEIYKNLSG